MSSRFLRIAWALAGMALLSISGCSDSRTADEAAKPRKILISVLAGQSTSDVGIEEMITDLVEKELPDIELDWERMDWGEKFESGMRAKFAAGVVPDLMIGKAQDVATYVPSGNLAPVPASLTKLVSEKALSSVTVNGVAYGIPYNAFYQGVFYNKALFRKYGLKVPQTRIELDGIVRVLKSKGEVPFASHFLENWFVGNIFMQFAIENLFDRERDWGRRFRDGRVSFSDSSVIRRCFDAVREIRDNTWSDALDVGQTECDERFAAQKAALYVTGSWTLQTLSAEKLAFDVGIFPYPNEGGDARLIFEPNLTFMMSSHSEHPEAVDRILKLIFESQDLAARIFDYTKTSSLLKDHAAYQPLLIQSDIDAYAKAGRIVDATVGNSQLIWSFQEEVANRTEDWLQGKIDLRSVLRYADRNRALSAP